MNRDIKIGVTILIWIAVLIIAVVLAYLMDGENLFLRFICHYPFVMAAIYLTRGIFKKHNP